MEKINFYTYKAAGKLPLGQLAAHFNIRQDAGWKEFIKIDGGEIEKILKYASENKAVYLFRYGVITFLNFDLNEYYTFLDYLSKLFVELDKKMPAQYHEMHTITVNKDGYALLWEDAEEWFRYSRTVDDIVACILAKSTELYMIESELNAALDEAENFIALLNRGRLRANTKKVVSTIAKCLRYKYMTVESARILDRPSEFVTMESRQIFDAFSNFFELGERYSVLTNRTNVLDSITGEYFDFRYNKSEMRLLLFEVLLLSMFPLMHLIS